MTNKKVEFGDASRHVAAGGDIEEVAGAFLLDFLFVLGNLIIHDPKIKSLSDEKLAKVLESVSTVTIQIGLSPPQSTKLRKIERSFNFSVLAGPPVPDGKKRWKPAEWDQVFDWYYSVPRRMCRDLAHLAKLTNMTIGTVKNQSERYQNENSSKTILGAVE